MSEFALPQRDSYFRPWLITIAFTVAAWLIYGRVTRPDPIPTFPPAAAGTETNGYFILRMPPITSQYESGIETMRNRYGEWLDAMTEAGYRPLLFSDLRRLTSDGVGVPAKSVVLMFDPGFRRTYHIVDPILKKHKWTAVWMSDLAAMEARHREYISFHTARQMVESGGWDVGLKKSDGTYLFDIGQETKFQIGQRSQGTWSPTSGGLGFNPRNTLYGLNCLNVIGDWLPKDIVNRLNAELPVNGPVFFTVGEVQNLLWGMTQATPTSFNLAAEPQQRSAVVSWLGTKGLDNSRIKIKGKGLAGTLSLRLRWDEASASGLQISLTTTRLTVQEWKNGENRPLYKANRAAQSDFSMMLLLVGDRLALSLDGANANAIAAPLSAGDGKGVTQIYLHDGVLGAARAHDVQVSFEPLPQSAVVFSIGSETL